MKMHELIRFDLPPAVLRLWETRESQTLLPLQELAVKRHDLFGPGNLLIQAPTSSGKTFIGEMAAIHTALRRKKVVYLVPLKALADEKYREFKEKYEDYGLRVIVSSRDHREFDGDLEEGNFSIAVVVYEKLSQLLVRRPERLEEVDLVIADELEILSDPDRGAMAELLLTRLLQAKRRLIGLSAVIGESERLAGWMGARLVHYEQRPVELRHGVLFEGRFRYRTHNARDEDEEEMIDAHCDSGWEVLTQNVAMLAGRGESCLIFVKAKHESRRGAEALARRVSLPAAGSAIETLRALEATRARDLLLETLASGVAFHNADLSPEERRAVEDAFRAGEVKVLVSTSTLAIGLNLPAHNVFLSAEKWRYDARLDIPWKAPIQHAEYENMGGRAGRYGAGPGFGRAILIATTPFDYETLWRRYVNGDREKIQPRLAQAPLEDFVLRLVASRFCRTVPELVRFLESTLTGRWIWAENYTLDEITCRVAAAVNRCSDAGVIAYSAEDRLQATPLGLAVAAKGISIAAARELEHWISQSESRAWSALDLMLAAARTPDGRLLQVMLTTREYERGGYPAELKRLSEGEESPADTPLFRLRNCPNLPSFEEVRAVKAALFLNDWISHRPVRELEETYDTMAGQVLSAAEQVSWLVDAAAAVAVALGCSAGFVDRIQALSTRVHLGIREEALALAAFRDHGQPLSRAALIALCGAGLSTPEAIAQAPRELLAARLPASAAKALHAWASRLARIAPPPAREDAQATEVRRVLVVDDARPGAILLDGVRIALQDKQFRLMRLLASRPGQCVPYDAVYSELWGDIVVESNQMHAQKRALLKRIQEALPDRPPLITAIAKRGFTLNLDPGQVLLRAACPTAA